MRQDASTLHAKLVQPWVFRISLSAVSSSGVAATIGVRFTVKEKVDQEKRSEDDIAKGIVKFLVDVYDETGETVALATILTMVKKRDQQ